MTNQEIANRLYELCQKGDMETIHQELFSDDVTSTEPNMQGQLETAHGREGLKKKGEDFNQSIEEVHSGYTNPPVVFGNHIFMEMGMDVTLKGMGRIDMREMCHYVIKDGKIISEEFFY